MGNVEQRFTGWLDSPLSPKGALQASACGKKLAALGPFDAMFCSDLIRARDTALGIAKEISFDPNEIQITKSLREKSAGVFTGVTFADAERNHPDLFVQLMERRWDYALPEGESNKQVAERVRVFFSELIDNHLNQKIIVVSHGVTISHVLRYLLRIAEDHFPKWVSFHSENTCVHHLLFREDGGCSVVTLNDTSHLASL